MLEKVYGAADEALAFILGDVRHCFVAGVSLGVALASTLLFR